MNLQDVSVLWATVRAGPGARGQYGVIREERCDARCCSSAVQALSLPRQSANDVSDSPDSAFSTSHIENGVIRIRNKVQRVSRPVEQRSPISRVIRHLGVSYASLL